MTAIRRLDHVAIAVRDTSAAVASFEAGLGLKVLTSEVIPSPHVRLTYIDCGNAMIQLVEPLDEESAIAKFIGEHGEGLHHICFGVEDVAAAAAALSPTQTPPESIGSGRGRPSAFLAGGGPCSVRIEVTEFSYEADVQKVEGWIPTTEATE